MKNAINVSKISKLPMSEIVGMNLKTEDLVKVLTSRATNRMALVEKVNKALKDATANDYDVVAQYAKKLSISEDTAFKIYNFYGFLDMFGSDQEEYQPSPLEATEMALCAISEGTLKVPKNIDRIEDIDSETKFGDALVMMTVG
jgi:hypothetical protein